MNKLVIENRTELSAARALEYAMRAATQFQLTESDMISNHFGKVTVHRSKTQFSETFVVAETVLDKRAVRKESVEAEKF